VRNLAWMVMVGVAALGCRNSLVGGGGGAAGGSAGAAGGGAPGGYGGLGGAGGAAGGGGQGAPTCLQDLFAACGLGPGYCRVERLDAGSLFTCFDSGASYTYAPAPPCGATDGGTVAQLVTGTNPDGSTCFVMSADFGSPTPDQSGGCYWSTVSYTWTDATGSTVATAQLANAIESASSLSLTCTKDGTHTSCTSALDYSSTPPCPSLGPMCSGNLDSCPFPHDAASP